MMDRRFWKGKKVFVTGHTGFKGTWFCLWLNSLGANVTGYALKSPTQPNMFELCNLRNDITSIISDIRNKKKLQQALLEAEPDIVIHMAAQPLVRDSYENPVATYEINVLGTIYLLDAVRKAVMTGKQIKAVINVTSDKCYENHEWQWGYREIDPLGGHDPYSNSKACSELATETYRKSFFNPNHNIHNVAIATARAGNVIGGGDWAKDRLIPDCVKSILKGKAIQIRNPNAVRPWQHVLEPLCGYLMLAQKLYEHGPKFAGAWNFGPDDQDIMTVEWVVQKLVEKWKGDISLENDIDHVPLHEAHCLKVDCSKAKAQIGWRPVWRLEQALDKIIEWTEAYSTRQDIRQVCLKQIEEYMSQIR